MLFLYSVISLLNMLSLGRSLSVRLSVCHSLLFEHYGTYFDETWTTVMILTKI